MKDCGVCEDWCGCFVYDVDGVTVCSCDGMCEPGESARVG